MSEVIKRGLEEIGICCEIMAEDGHMARTPELMEIAKKYNLRIVTIKSLIEYIENNEMKGRCNFIKTWCWI